MRVFGIIFICFLLSQQLYAQNDSTVKILFVDEEPTFPGGDRMLNKFIEDNLVYPPLEKDAKIQGTVYVQFTIDTKGYVKDVNVVKGVSKRLDEEALRIVNSMPQWAYGTRNGNPADIKYDLPIVFRLK